MPSVPARPAEVVLPSAVRAALVRAAERAYPHEACGLLAGRADAQRVALARLFEVPNRAACARSGYVLAPQDWCAADADAHRAGLELVGVWHSHPDAAATPSGADLAAAWPEYVYLIAAVRAGAVVELRGWQREGAAFAARPIRSRR